MYLADAFIQNSDSAFRLYIIVSVFPGIEPQTFALLTQCSTTEPQETLLPYKAMIRKINLSKLHHLSDHSCS